MAGIKIHTNYYFFCFYLKVYINQIKGIVLNVFLKINFMWKYDDAKAILNVKTGNEHSKLNIYYYNICQYLFCILQIYIMSI